jgi:hypothetical protein
LVFYFLKVIVKEVVSEDMSLFLNEVILTKEIASWKSFGDCLSSKEDRELFEKMLNDCYKYAAAAINAKGEPFPAEPLIMALLLSQHKMIDWITELIIKQESDNKEVKQSKQQEEIGRGNAHDYIRMNERIHYIDDY